MNPGEPIPVDELRNPKPPPTIETRPPPGGPTDWGAEYIAPGQYDSSEYLIPTRIRAHPSGISASWLKTAIFAVLFGLCLADYFFGFSGFLGK